MMVHRLQVPEHGTQGTRFTPLPPLHLLLRAQRTTQLLPRLLKTLLTTILQQSTNSHLQLQHNFKGSPSRLPFIFLDWVIFMKLTMGLWRRIQKLEIEIEESNKYLEEQREKLAQVDNDTFFDVLSKKLEIAIAENNLAILKRKTELVNEALENDKKENIAELYCFVKQAILSLLDKKSKEIPEAKESKTNYENMNAYQKVIHLYSVLHREYRWTRQTIDSEEIEYIYDLSIVQALGKEPKTVSIEDAF